LTSADQREVRADLRIQFWRLRIYSAGFLVAFALHLAIDGIGRPPVLLLVPVVAIAVGMLKGAGPWLRAGVMLGILHALIFPILQQAVGNGEAVAAVVARVSAWPQLLVTLIGSRVLAVEGKLSFAQFWRFPTKRIATVEIQSIPSAIALGSFLTIVFYLVTPYSLTPSAKQTSDIIVSAMLGGTVVHTAIIFLFFVILSSIIDAAQSHVADRAVLTSFGRQVEDERKAGSKRDLASILADEFPTAGHTRAFRLLNAAIETKKAGRGSPATLSALSFDGFQMASRHFVRALLPLLPLLGFLGTVIGLATAISELPHGLTGGTEQAFDVSASLAGLAVKFETTLLGLLASMLSSFSFNFLEKREAELAAACMLIVKDVGERDV
jgi:biopolymer transport protein ExbB/TolQ